MAQPAPKKRFGQHFLADAGVLQRIATLADVRDDEVLIEIGPGRGALTEQLVERCDKLVVIEVDRDLAPRLKTRFGAKLEVIQADVLTVDFAAFGDRLNIVGNLPYNISTPILFHLFEHAAQVRSQTFMLQKEVVDRMVAQRGRDAGRLGVMLQCRYAMKSVLHVPPQAFEPPPKVDSAVVRMTPIAPAPRLDVRLLGEVVAAAYSQRRKLLRHSLGEWLRQQGFADIEFNLQRRAEEVLPAEYYALVDKLAQRRALPAA